MGLFDMDNTDIFGGFFDLDGDGKVSWDEEFIANKIIAEYFKDEEDDKPDYDMFDETVSFDAGAPLADEPEVEDALQDSEIKEDDYPNRRRYNAAHTLADEFLVYISDEEARKEKACCRFILDYAETILAADYLTHEGRFLYAQAIKDNFSLPCSLPDEDETREMEPFQILCKIAKRDIPLSFEIWSWCLEQFLPYSEYDEFCRNDLGSWVITNLYSFPEGYVSKLVHYMNENDNFCKSLMTSCDESANGLPELIAEAIKEKLYNLADALFKDRLRKVGRKWQKINALTEGVINRCKSYKEPESMEYFKVALLPIVKEIPLGMVQDEIEEWEKDIEEYISEMIEYKIVR